MAFPIRRGAHDEDPDFAMHDADSSSEESDWSFDDEPRIGDELPDYAGVEVLLPTRQPRTKSTARSSQAQRPVATNRAAVMCTQTVEFTIFQFAISKFGTLKFR